MDHEPLVNHERIVLPLRVKLLQRLVPLGPNTLRQHDERGLLVGHVVGLDKLLPDQILASLQSPGASVEVQDLVARFEQVEGVPPPFWARMQRRVAMAVPIEAAARSAARAAAEMVEESPVFARAMEVVQAIWLVEVAVPVSLRRPCQDCSGKQNHIYFVAPDFWPNPGPGCLPLDSGREQSNSPVETRKFRVYSVCGGQFRVRIPTHMHTSGSHLPPD